MEIFIIELGQSKYGRLNYTIFSIIFLAIMFVPVLPAWSKAEQKPTSIKARYDALDNKMVISWSGPLVAGSEFRLRILSADGSPRFSRITSKQVIELSPGLFIKGEELLLSVEVVLNRKVQSHLRATKTYKFISKVRTPATFGTLATKNSSGRSGALFLPKNYRLKEVPVMLLFHGSSIDGTKIARRFKKLANNNGFVIVAPDSVSEEGWEISDDVNNPSEDQAHILACIAELKNLPHLKIKADKFLVAGVSAGGALASIYGGQDSQFSAFAVMHGGVYIDLIGENRVPVWLSTGTSDSLRPPSELMSYKTALQELGFTNVVYNEYAAPHAVPEEEKRELIEWWLQ